MTNSERRLRAALEAARERAVTRIGWLYISQSFGYEMDEARAEYEALIVGRYGDGRLA